MQATQTVEIASVIDRQELCRTWPRTSYSKKDTKQTIRGNRYNNKVRWGICHKKNTANKNRISKQSKQSSYDFFESQN